MSAGFATTLAKLKYLIAPRRHSTEAEAAGFGEAIQSSWTDETGIDEFCPSGRIENYPAPIRPRSTAKSMFVFVCSKAARLRAAQPRSASPCARCRRASTTTGGVFRAIPDKSGKLGQLSELRTTTNPQARTHSRREARSRHPRSPGHYHWRPSSSLGPIEKSVRFRPGIYLRQTRR